MKEMIYKKIRSGSIPVEMLSEGTYKNYQYAIVSFGTHPCAYVKIPEGHRLYYICDEFDPKIESIRCHGGITCISTGGILKGNVENYREGHWIGWDYLHPGDYEANMHPLGRKWTTKEILDDVKNVIKQLVQM